MRKLLPIIVLATALLAAQDLSDYRIYINPGHGGHDSDDRHILATDFWESEGNLTKGLELRKILENLGATTSMSRTQNRTADDLPLSTIGYFANNFNADFFHSIHSNGWQGIHNSTLMLYRGWDRNVSGYNYGYNVTGALYPLSLDMSDIMVTEIYRANRTTGRSVRGDWSFYGWTDDYGNKMGLGVLRQLTMPGTLSEGSFHDYIPESWRLQNLDYRRNEAWAIANSFVQLYETDPFPTRNLAGLVRDSFNEVDYFYLNNNDRKQPVNNITVTLKPIGQVYHGDEMNNGYYLFDSLAPGDYTVVVQADGYYPDSTDVTLDDKFFNFADFILYSSRPPIVKSIVPEEGENIYPAWEPIEIQFNKPMDTTATKTAISLDPPLDFGFDWAESLMKVTLLYDTLAFETEYTLTIDSSAHDIFGIAIDGNADGTGGDDFVLHFSSSARDIDPPFLAEYYPAYNQHDVELRPIINLIFDEVIDTSSITPDIIEFEEYPNDYFVPYSVAHYIVNKQSIVSFFPEEKLKADQVYKVRLREGYRDRFQNVSTRRKTLSFRTGIYDYEVTDIDNFDTGLLNNWKTPTFSGSTTGVIDDSLTFRDADFTTVNVNSGSYTSMALGYHWNTEATEWLLREYLGGGAPFGISFDNSYILQAYVFGDGSHNQFRFAVDDKYPTLAGENHEVSPWYTIDWIGWQPVTWDLATDTTGEWLGDGSLDGNLRFDSFQLTYNADDPEAFESGVIYIDDLQLIRLQAVGVGPERQPQTEEFALLHNYPNPFNPATTIQYNLPEMSLIRLEIYNLTGQRIETLVKERQPAGAYSLRWDASPYGSGIYLIRLQTEHGTLTRKCVFMK